MAEKEKEGVELEQEDEDNKPTETILEKKEERDPDEAVFAEQAIHHYANDVLDLFREQIDSAMSTLESFLMSQSDQSVFNDRQFLEGMGEKFMHHIMSAFGGKHTPIAQAVFPMIDGMVDESARDCNALEFVHDLSTVLRDASWFLRDNLESVLSNQWDHLRDLAYEGSTDFIPALHAYGLPQMDFDAKTVTQPMEHYAAEFQALQPKKKEEQVEKDQVAQFEEEEKKLEQDPEAQNLALEEEEKEAMA
jgi:hypothetical protein